MFAQDVSGQCLILIENGGYAQSDHQRQMERRRT
jgi:hypothetical protein